MAVTFEGFSAYARLGDPQLVDDSERLTAELCLRAAMDHARGTGIPADKLDEEDNAKFELYIYAMASHWFDNRAFNSSISINAPRVGSDVCEESDWWVQAK